LKTPFNPKAKLWWHGDRVKEWLETGRTTPSLAEVSPTGYCNARCPWCFFKEKWTGDQIDPNVMVGALHAMPDLGIKAVNWTGGGEPVLHPQFSEFVALAADLKLKQGLFTNAYQEIPHQEAFEWIRISMTDKHWHEIVKPHVPFGMVVNETPVPWQLNMTHLRNYKKSESERINSDLCLRARSVGAAYFQIRPALSQDFKDQPVLTEPVYLHDYATDEFKVFTTPYKYLEAARPRHYKDCYGYHICPSIDWRGHVVACLYLSDDPDYILGNLNEDPLPNIWRDIPNKVPVIDACQHCCKNHEINKVMAEARSCPNRDFL
jgi:MoaA/NifB/PqqE/SkfB family radical SAM enzyme